MDTFQSSHQITDTTGLSSCLDPIELSNPVKANPVKRGGVNLDVCQNRRLYSITKMMSDTFSLDIRINLIKKRVNTKSL